MASSRCHCGLRPARDRSAYFEDARRKLAIAFLSILALVDCTPTRPTHETLTADPPAPTTMQTAPPGTVDAGAHGEGLVGWWTSDGCGPRHYRRTLELRADGTFRSDDIVHPCPGECVVQWTVQRLGTWTLQGKEIRLGVKHVEDPMKQEPEAQAVPSALVIESGAVVEKAGDGSLCPYAH